MIRAATPDDLEAIMRLERASFPTDAWSDAMMREELASPHGRYVVLEQAGRLVGYAGVRAVAGARDGDVQTIAVAEASRGRGSGRMLLRTLVALARERGVRDLFLEVRADNPVAQALYASEGFAVAGRRPRYYQPDDVDAIVMTLDVPAWTAARGSDDRGAGAGAGAGVGSAGSAGAGGAGGTGGGGAAGGGSADGGCVTSRPDAAAGAEDGAGAAGASTVTPPEACVHGSTGAAGPAAGGVTATVVPAAATADAVAAAAAEGGWCS